MSKIVEIILVLVIVLLMGMVIHIFLVVRGRLINNVLKTRMDRSNTDD
jgi:hypothetical protein